jgi:GH25 family lysozyme M1 (1,4-beta-N-acetylmuramidase)
MNQLTFPNYVFGGDSSVWDDINETPQRPDFQKAYNNGWRFNYHRTSFGLSIDSDYRVNWSNSRKTKLLLGNYHFLVWTQSPEAQADFFWNIIKDDPGELPLVCDFEWWSVIPADAFDLLYRFLEQLKKHTNKKIMIYTAYSFWKQYGKKDNYWKQYLVWLAHYNNTPPLGSLDVPLPWIECDFWQFTGHGDGLLYGMESKDVDLDFYMGTYNELLNLCGLAELPEEPKEEEEKFMYSDNDMGLYLEDKATWVNPNFKFIVAKAGDISGTNPVFKTIVENAVAKKTPLIALFPFNAHYYTEFVFNDESRLPKPEVDKMFQAFVESLKFKTYNAVVIEVKDVMFNGKPESPNWIDWGLQMFMKRVKNWLSVNKPTAKLMISINDETVKTYCPNLAMWLKDFDVYVDQPGVINRSTSYPIETSKPRHYGTTWKCWKFYDATPLVLFNGKVASYLNGTFEPPVEPPSKDLAEVKIKIENIILQLQELKNSL